MVYKAVDNATGNKVAIKVIDVTNASADLLKLVVREVVILDELSMFENNEYTVSLKDMYFNKGAKSADEVKTVYLVMNYCGTNVDDVIYAKKDNLTKN